MKNRKIDQLEVKAVMFVADKCIDLINMDVFDMGIAVSAATSVLINICRQYKMPVSDFEILIEGMGEFYKNTSEADEK